MTDECEITPKWVFDVFYLATAFEIVEHGNYEDLQSATSGDGNAFFYDGVGDVDEAINEFIQSSDLVEYFDTGYILIRKQ